jgi:hypothetical protein
MVVVWPQLFVSVIDADLPHDLLEPATNLIPSPFEFTSSVWEKLGVKVAPQIPPPSNILLSPDDFSQRVWDKLGITT